MVWFFFEKSFLESSHLVRKSSFSLFNGVNIWANTLVFADKSPGVMVQDKKCLPIYWGKLKKSYTFLAELTFDAGLDLAVPLPTAVAEQRERRLLVAHDVALGTDVQKLVPHFKASVAVQDGVGEGRRVPTGLV